MSYTLEIPIVNHSADCVQQYNVEYRRTDEAEFQTLYPAPKESPIRIPDLLAGDYVIRISKTCCNGTETKYTSFTQTIGA